MSNRLAWILGLVMLLVIAERPAQAYIDPGTASYMFQVVAGAVLGGVFLARSYLSRMMMALRSRRLHLHAKRHPLPADQPPRACGL